MTAGLVGETDAADAAVGLLAADEVIIGLLGAADDEAAGAPYFEEIEAAAAAADRRVGGRRAGDRGRSRVGWFSGCGEEEEELKDMTGGSGSPRRLGPCGFRSGLKRPASLRHTSA